MRETKSASLDLQDPAPPMGVRLGSIGVLIFLALSLLLARLWQLQGIEGGDLRVQSENNRLRLKRTPPLRGIIADRYGRVLVDNRPAFNVVLVPEDVKDIRTTVDRLARYLPEDVLLTDTQIPFNSRGFPYQGVTLARDVPRDTLVSVETNQVELPGINVEVSSRRIYPPDGFAAHVFGYVGEVNKQELKKQPDYSLGDLIGKFGLEKYWEPTLRGEGGVQTIEVDANGQRLQIIDRTQATAGTSLILTIDADLQKAAEAAMRGWEGALVVLDVRTGEVLAMVSQPAFDPNLFARGIRRDEWQNLVRDPLHPLNNRAIQGQYPPGSTFKVIMAVAALEEGVVTPATRFYCSGGLQFGGHRFRCWKRRGHGSQNLQEAIAHSCDVYFYQLGQRLGIQGIAEYARLFGLGSPLGIGLDHEAPGLIPDAEWKQKVLKAPWLPGETLSVVIGQGYVTATPLQMAAVAAAMANGGTIYRPQLVKQAIRVDGEVVAETTPEVVRKANIRPDVMQLVREGMRDVVNSSSGTAKAAHLSKGVVKKTVEKHTDVIEKKGENPKFLKLPHMASIKTAEKETQLVDLSGILVAGKTGTSQVISGTRGKGKILPRQYRDHAWFIAFAPFDTPEVAVACVVEHAGAGGGKVAAPIVREVLKAYFASPNGNRYVKSDVR